MLQVHSSASPAAVPAPSPRRILIVEDDSSVSRVLAEFLGDLGFSTSVVMNGSHVEAEVRRAEPSLVLLDVTLPGIDGIEVCHQLRRFSSVPIIMLSGRTDEIDRTLGLEVGADDYVCKPFSAREMAARIKAQLRRAEGRLGTSAATHGFRVDEGAQRIGWGDQWLPLTPLEFRLLRKLLSRPGHVFSRDELLDSADSSSRASTARAVDSHVKNLRRKIAAVRPEGSAIEGVYGLGYRLDVELNSD